VKKNIAHRTVYAGASFCIAVSAQGLATAAWAEKALEEVTVTAQKKDDTLQTVPMTVNAVTADAIEKYNLLDFKDVAQLAPGLTIEANNARTANVSLRGIQVNTDAAAGVAVSIYWNEVNYDIDSAFKAMYDVSQLEILRGPQGTLRGITAPAGAITIATRTPNYSSVDGYLQQSFSDRNLSNSQFGVSLPIIEDKLAVRIAAIYDHNDANRVENVVTGTRESAETRSGRITVGFRPIESVETNLIYQHLETVADSFLNQLVGIGASGTFSAFDRNSATNLNGFSHTRRDIATLNATWELDHHQLTYIGGYQRQSLQNVNDLDYGNALPNNGILQNVSSHIPSWTHELRFASTDADFYNYTYGIYYSNGYNSTAVSQPQLLRIVAGVPQFLAIATPIDIVSEGYAAFTNQSLQLTDDTEVQLGLRYQKQRSAIDSGLTARAGGTTYTDLTQQFVAVDEALTGSASISHQLAEDIRIYANYGRSFRPSGRLPVPANPPLAAGTWNPETSDSLELGFKSRFNDGRIQLNGDVFYQKFHDYIARASYIWTNNSAAGVLNNTYGFNYSADVIVQGAELSLDALLTENWQLGTSLSYTDAKFDNAAKPCNVFDAGGSPVQPTTANATANGAELAPGGEYFVCNSSGRLGTEPNWMASVSSEYVWPLVGYQPFVRGLYNFRSGRAEDTVQNGDTPSYGVFNLYLGVRGSESGWELSLWAKNLFDHRATTATTDSIQQAQIIGAPIATGYHSVQIIPAREVGITGTYNF
jgi:iron complex outermembrane recepter protein